MFIALGLLFYVLGAPTRKKAVQISLAGDSLVVPAGAAPGSQAASSQPANETNGWQGPPQ
jgi:hypothetical protein